MADTVSSHDYLPVFHFKVTIRNKSHGFKEVSGLGIELETEDVLEGGGYGYVYRLPKPAKARNLVLKRAMQKTSDDLLEWINEAIVNVNFNLDNIIVSLVDENDKPVKKWQFFGAYPLKVTYSGLDSTKNELFIQTLELAYQRQTVEDVT